MTLSRRDAKDCFHALLYEQGREDERLARTERRTYEAEAEPCAQCGLTMQAAYDLGRADENFQAVTDAAESGQA